MTPLQWSGDLVLMKIKSHTGCLLNERADEYAELGRSAEGPELCSGPQKYGSLWLRVKPIVLEFAQQIKKSLPRDSAPNKVLSLRFLRSTPIEQSISGALSL